MAIDESDIQQALSDLQSNVLLLEQRIATLETTVEATYPTKGERNR